jgi:hypothetical protein
MALRHAKVAMALILGALGAATAASADGMDVRRSAPTAPLALHCNNGHVYPLQPRAVSDAGELVTGALYTRPHRAARVRLVPMGYGYRYAGRGIWFDGVRGDAALFTRNFRGTGCTVG